MKKIFSILLLLVCFNSFSQRGNGWRYNEADAASYITRVEATGATMTANQKNAIKIHVKNLNIWSLYSKVTDAATLIGGTANAHAETLKGNVDITWNGTVTHASTGITGNGTDGYGNTGVLANSLPANDQHISAYSRTNVNASYADIGARGATVTTFTLIQIRSATNLDLYINSSTIGTGRVQAANPSSEGFYIGTRISSTDLRAAKNGAQLGTTATTTNNGAAAAQNMYVCAYNNNGTAQLFSVREYCFFSWGSGLTITESTTYSTIVNNLQISLGRNIY